MLLKRTLEFLRVAASVVEAPVANEEDMQYRHISYTNTSRFIVASPLS